MDIFAKKVSASLSWIGSMDDKDSMVSNLLWGLNNSPTVIWEKLKEFFGKNPHEYSAPAARILSLLSWALYLAMAVCAVIVFLVFPKWTIDDAYITIRYASNWAHFSELTWNLGENPVEGYTGILLPILLGLGIKANIDPVALGHVLGVGSFAIGGFLVYAFLKQIKVSPILRCIGVALYLTVPELYLHSLGGLETLLFTMLILMTLLVLLINLDGTKNYSTGWEVFLMIVVLLVSLVRPEGVVLAITTIGALCFVRLKSRSNIRATLRQVGFFYIIPGGFYFIWRWNYYGQLLPNTFYAKRSDHFRNSSVEYWKSFVETNMTFLLVGILIVGLVLIETSRNHEERWWRDLSLGIRPTLLAGLIFTGVVITQYCHSKLIMNYSHRFFMPFLPLFFIGWIFVLSRSFRILREFIFASPIVRWITCAALGICLYGQIRANMARLPGEARFAAKYMKLMEDVHIKAGNYIKKNVPASEWMAVYIDAGHIPYLSGLRTIDFGKLNDETLARNNSATDAANYFYSFRPGVAVFTSSRWNELSPGGSDMRNAVYLIIRDDRFLDYVLVKKYRTDARRNYYEFVYFRKDLVQDS